MEPKELFYCLHNGSIRDEDERLTIITFCPIQYWKEHACLPDYNFYDEITETVSIPNGFDISFFVEETQWCSIKSVEEIRSELNQLGFVENIEMENFLTGCWE